MGIRHMTTHAGFIPEPTDPRYSGVIERIGKVADALHAAGCTMGLETGQESAAVLLQVMKDLGRDFVSANFDPANFVLYGSDDPVHAAQVLAGRVKMAHMKDGLPSARPGADWGEDVPPGKGKVDFPAVLKALFDGGFTGPLIIEREAGNDRAGDLVAAKKFLERVLARM